MRKLILIALVGLAACTSSTSPNNSQSGYLGMWIEHNGHNPNDTLDFTTRTNCTLTSNGDVLAPTVEDIGDTGCSLDWQSGVDTYHVTLWLNTARDTLAGGLLRNGAGVYGITFVR